MADKSDPRMPTAVKHYVAPLVNPNDLPPDYSSLLAIIFGILGVMMRVSLFGQLHRYCFGYRPFGVDSIFGSGEGTI